MLQYLIIVLSVVIPTAFSAHVINEKPIIGVFMQESVYDEDGYPTSQYSYISASYVKFVEMAGARVVPVYYDGDQNYYDEMFEQVNGFLWPGGDADFSKDTYLGQNSYYILQKAIEANKNGVFYPLWGTCNGFELLATLSTNFSKVLSNITDESGVNHQIKIHTPGTLYSEMPNHIYQSAQEEDLQYFNHHFCISLDTFNTNQLLRQFWHLSATAKNDQGEEFVAAIESKEFPFYGVQFHPEKSIFEWKVNANHSLNAVENTQYYADFFVQQARKNNHDFKTLAALEKALIYNYSPVQLEDSSFEQIYFFKNFRNMKIYKNRNNSFLPKFLP